MTILDHPAWRGYKSALVWLAAASARVEEARTEGALQVEEAERKFQEALKAYEAAQERLREPGGEA